MNNVCYSRRSLVKSSLLGALAISTPNLVFASSKSITRIADPLEERYYRYPAIDDDTASEVVGKSHSDFDKVKALVTKRPELARANWDWGFGDWESALGAASHMGRRDIAQLLIAHGARPNIFTYAMLGHLEVVKAMIEANPGAASTTGPHGITLLQHARIGLRMDTMTGSERNKVQQVIDYLQAIGGADTRPNSEEVSDTNKDKYQGEYRYGDGESDIFFVSLNMRKSLTFGRKGTFGTGIYLKSDGVFSAYAAPSIQITFELSDDKVSGLTLVEPDLVVKAVRII